MTRLELVAGNFGTGRADWINFEFHLPKKQRLPIEAIASVEENGEYLEKTILGFIKGGATGALGLGATAAVVGVFAAPLAAVGAIGLTAAAIGGGLGAFGGATERKVLLQVMGVDGRGFVAICERELPGEIRKAVSVAHAMRMRIREGDEAPQPKGRISSVWERRPKAAVPAAAAIPAAVAAAALPAPEAVEMQQDADGIFRVAGNALSATAETATALAADAVSATTGAVEGAWSAVTSRLPWGSKQA